MLEVARYKTSFLSFMYSDRLKFFRQCWKCDCVFRNNGFAFSDSCLHSIFSQKSCLIVELDIVVTEIIIVIAYLKPQLL